MTSGRIPSLDGLRAVSIALVLIAHVMLMTSSQPPETHWLVAPMGPLGVSVFFGISGFLITSLLVRERERTGSIDLGAFYVRRAFRILPAFWVFMAVSAFIGVGVSATGWLNSVLFLADYREAGSWWLGHTWSLAVEEQFYLLWPVALWFLGPKRATPVAWALSAGAPVIRLASYFLLPSMRGRLNFAFHNRIDAIMVGCLLALLLEADARHWLVRLFSRGALAAGAAVVLLLVSPVLEHLGGSPYRLLVGLSVEAFGAGAIIMWAMSAPASFVGRFLNWRPVAHLGALSYSLYLWQQPFFERSVGASFPVYILGPLLLAELSYRVVEQPMLRLRARMTRAREIGASSRGSVLPS